MINSVSNSNGIASLGSPENGGLNYVAIKTRINAERKKQYDKKSDTDKFGLRLAKVGLLTGLIVFIVLKGAPRKVRSKLDQANKNFIDKDIIVGEGERTGFKYKIKKSLNRFMNYSKAIFNLAPLKDVVVGKALKLSKFSDRIGQSITNTFERISVRTLNDSYGKTHMRFEKLFADFVEANKKLPKNEVDIINKKIQNIRKIYADGFSEAARRERLNAVKNEFDGYDETGKHKIGDSLMDKVWKETYKNFKKFMKESAYTKFVSEEKATETKLRNATKVNNYKFLISNSLNSMCEDSFKLLIHLDTFIEHDDMAARSIIKKIATPLNQYKKVVKNHGNGKSILLNGDIVQNLKKLDAVFKNSKKYDSKTIEEVSLAIKSLTARLEQNKRGEVNEIMKIYEKHLSPEDYKKMRQSAYATTNSLTHSTDLETDKLFDKIRDLKIGSAPKDMLIVLSSFGVVGYGLSRADNAEEKISAGIKYGIPTIGAVAIMVYCTVGLISAGPSLLIGLLSGLALNQIGTGVDNFRKQIKNKTSKVG